MNRKLILFCTLSILLCALAFARSPDPTPLLPQGTAETPGHRLLQPGAQSEIPDPFAAAAMETTILGEWTFDDGLGGPDPQGWTTLDFTAVADTFFHVDDFHGLNGGDHGGLVPIQGLQSLWCGTRVSGSASQYADEGYGNSWNQRFESVAFPVTGDVTMDYLISYDSEPIYDWTYVDYLSKSGLWNTLTQYNGTGQGLDSVTVPADSLAGTVRLRFRFLSDMGWSDEDGAYNSDGAVIIDSLTVRDAGGVVDFQDFEAEAVFALGTVDGDWMATVLPGYGDYAALFDGSGVLQEDPLVTNNTNLWGFFNGSDTTYACGGHPEQLAVPYHKNSDEAYPWIKNGIVSPVLPVPEMAPTNQLLLEFDVYRDLPVPPSAPYGVSYIYQVRSFLDESWQSWYGSGCYYGDAKDWFRFSHDIMYLLPVGATDFQVAITVQEIDWDTCHSHSPLVDNVLIAIADSIQVFMVTNTNASGPGSFEQAVIDANAHGSGRIHFDIPGPGPHEVLRDNYMSIIGWTVIDGSTQPGYAGTPLIRLRQVGEDWRPVLGIGSHVVVRGLELDGLGINHHYQGIHLAGDSGIVEACRILNCEVGVSVEANNCRIGGISPEQANKLTGNGVGIHVPDDPNDHHVGNSIRGNRIYLNSELGIDIGPQGVTPNDPGDLDTGANNLQNYPVLTGMDASTHTIQGSLDSQPGVAGPAVYEIDFYASAICDPSGYGEGERYLAGC